MKAGEFRSWYEVEVGTLESERFCGGQFVHYSRRCPSRVTSPNEDASCVVQFSRHHGLIAVADGVGGANAGNVAARIAIESLTTFAKSAGSNGNRRSEILDAIEASNQEILERGSGSGATLAVVEFCNSMVRTFHTGDAKVMLISNRGRVKYATIGHAPVAMQVAIGLLEEDEALRHEERNLISNCVGCREMKIEIGPVIPMAARDTLVVASDGLFDNLLTDEIADIIRTGDLVEKTDVLTRTAMERMDPSAGTDAGHGKADDLTVICFRRDT